MMGDNFDIEEIENDDDIYDNRKSRFRNSKQMTITFNVPDQKLKDLLVSEERTQLVFDCLEIDNKIDQNTIVNYFMGHVKTLDQDDDTSDDSRKNSYHEGNITVKTTAVPQKVS